MVKPDSHIKQLLEIMSLKKKIRKENYEGNGGAYGDWGHGDLCQDYSHEANTVSACCPETQGRI